MSLLWRRCDAEDRTLPDCDLANRLVDGLEPSKKLALPKARFNHCAKHCLERFRSI